MQDFEGRVAVITGAASGIGRGLARHAAAEGMKLVLADVDDAALAATGAELEEAGARVVTAHTDVTDPAALEALAELAEREGGIHLLCNNAGVLVGGAGWETSAADWEWQLGVNLFGVIHGLRVFVPRLLAAGEPAHIVNTASIGGLTTGPFLTPYLVSKHAVVALSECTYLELQATGAPVGLSVLCPAEVRTGIMDSNRVRPAGLPRAQARAGAAEAFERGLGDAVEKGMEPGKVARQVFDAVRADRFWVLTHEGSRAGVEARMRGILEGSNPAFSIAVDRDAG